MRTYLESKYVRNNLVEDVREGMRLLDTDLSKPVRECDLYEKSLYVKLSPKAEVLESGAENIEIVGDIVNFMARRVRSERWKV